MQHARFFRKLREQRGLTLDALAALARRHRNTIINLENGRPVKFPTIALLMEKMGYTADSPEMAGMALLWVESISGVALSSSEKLRQTRRKISDYRRDPQRQTARLMETIRRSALGEREIRLLDFAAGEPAAMRILSAVHELRQAAESDTTALKAAESK